MGSVSGIGSQIHLPVPFDEYNSQRMKETKVDHEPE